MRHLAAYSLLLILFACRPAGETSLKVVEVVSISDIRDDVSTIEPRPQNTLTLDHRTTQLVSSACGFTEGSVVPFKSDVQGPFFEESIWRSYARPAQEGACGEGENYEDRKCWRDYGLQFFPVAKRRGTNHFLVFGTSPLIRVLPQKDYPEPSKACTIKNPTALIFVPGVRNPNLGTSWRNVDNDILSSVLSWNRNPNLPSSAEKLPNLPGYIQIVPNSNTLADGIQGSHEEAAIETLARNIELAYRSGVETLEIVSHSNGMITTQIGLTLFVKRILRNSRDWLADRNRMHRHPDKMRVYLSHLQSAPSQIWSQFELDSFHSFSDFIPNAKWVVSDFDGVAARNWHWDFSLYRRMKPYLNLTIKYFYNRPDWSTYDPYFLSSVGRHESLAWHDEVITEGLSSGADQTIQHFSCDENDTAVCGPDHDQSESLWSFSSPIAHQGRAPIQWNLELSSMPGDGLAESARVAARGAQDAVTEGAARAMPTTVCIDLTQSRDECRRQAEGKMPPPPESISLFVKAPTYVCAHPGDQNSPCTRSKCGDGICGIGESRRCRRDCFLPDRHISCVCREGVCKKQTLSCSQTGCASQVRAVESCICPDKIGRRVTCEASSTHCEVLPLLPNGPGCRRISYHEGARGLTLRTCQNEECTAARPTAEALNLRGRAAGQTRDIRTRIVEGVVREPR